MKKRMRILRRWLALLAAAALLGIGLSASAQETEKAYVENKWNYVDESMDVSAGIPDDALGALEKIRLSGKVRVATEPYYPPQEFIDPALSGQDKYVGADMSLARLIAERMGAELEIVPMEFTRVLTAVAEGECDLAISALSYTPGRASYVELSKGYYFAEEDAGSGLLIRVEDQAAITGLGSLRDKTVVAQSGSLQESLAAEHITAYLEFRRLSSAQDAFRAVQEGKADAAMVDLDAAQRYIQQTPECGLMLVPSVRFLREPQYDGDRIAAKKGEIQLMYFVNGVIDEALSAGLYDQWFRESDVYAAKLGL